MTNNDHLNQINQHTQQLIKQKIELLKNHKIEAEEKIKKHYDSIEHLQKNIDRIGKMLKDSDKEIERYLIYLITTRYLRLPYPTQVKIASKLEIFEKSDHLLDKCVLFKKVIQRAQDKNILTDLSDAIKEYE